MSSLIHAKKLLLLIVAIIAGCGSLAEAKCAGQLWQYLPGGPIPESARLNLIAELHAQGAKSIAILLGNLDDNTEYSLGGLENPTSSTLYERTPIYCGAVSAYLIEVILARAELTMNGGHGRLLGDDPRNYPYEAGQIRVKDGTGGGRALQLSELPDLARVYREWWERNKARSMRQLREAWIAGDGPTTGSKFFWR